MFITELSIRRPVVSWVMSLILIVFGLFVFWKLPVRELPSGIQPPVVQVQVDYSSAAAPIVNQEVTQEVIRLTWKNPAFMAIAIALIWLIPQLLIYRVFF